MELIKKPNKYLSLLSIESAEDIQKLRLKMMTDLKNAKELSALIKEDFPKRLDYSLLFSKAYFSTYNEEISPLDYKNLKTYIERISRRLECPLNLDEKEIGQLVDFCANLSDFSAINEQDIRNLRAGGSIF